MTARSADGPWLKEYPNRIRRVEVLRRDAVTPRMLRLTFGGPGLAGFESHSPDEHVKILFPDPDGEPDGELRLPEQDGDKLVWPRPLPVSREYTVRRYDAGAGELDIDFVLHDGGLASSWAATVQLGSSVWIAGPPRGLIVPDEYDYYVFAGDETALPAIARSAGELPRTAIGRIGILVHDATEEQPIEAPEGIQLSWLHRTGDPVSLLEGFLDSTVPPSGARTYLWVAGEQRLLKPARSWAQQHGVRRHDRHTTGYWRAGRAGD
ncbi:MAG: siderophore-interacting protein [Nocardioidaceae bacterium]